MSEDVQLAFRRLPRPIVDHQHRAATPNGVQGSTRVPAAELTRFENVRDWSLYRQDDTCRPQLFDAAVIQLISIEPRCEPWHD